MEINLCRVNTGLFEFQLDQFQHDRLSAATDTGHDLDQLRSDKRTDTAHIQFAFDHKISLLSVAEHSIPHLQLKFSGGTVNL